MGPEYAAAAAVITAVTTATATVMQGKAQADAAKAQGAWADRQAMDEKAAAQRQASEELRRAQLAKSRLMATAGASGSGASDPTVLQLGEGITREGIANAGIAQADGQRKADHMTYQAALDRWTANANRRIGYVKAGGTLIGGALDGRSRLSMKYGNGGTTGRTGY